MKNMILGMAIAAAFSTNASAQTNGAFIELGAGATKATLDVPAGFTSNESSSGYTLIGGYMLSPNIGFEGGYTDLGKAGLSTSGAITGTLYGNPITITGTAGIEGKSTGLLLGVRGVVPITEKFSIAARAGLFNWTTDVTVSATGTITYLGATTPVGGSAKKTYTGTDSYVGLRGSYAITKSTAMGLGYTRYWIGGDIETTVNSTDLSLTYSF